MMEDGGQEEWVLSSSGERRYNDLQACGPDDLPYPIRPLPGAGRGKG